MTDPTQLYIDGAWTDGATQIENRNPSDTSDLIGMYAQADAVQLDDGFCEADHVSVLGVTLWFGWDAFGLGFGAGFFQATGKVIPFLDDFLNRGCFHTSDDGCDDDRGECADLGE